MKDRINGAIWGFSIGGGVTTFALGLVLNAPLITIIWGMLWAGMGVIGLLMLRAKDESVQ